MRRPEGKRTFGSAIWDKAPTAIVTALSLFAGVVFGARLETVKTANSAGLEFTKRRIEKTSELYEQIQARYLEVGRMQRAITMAMFPWEGATGQAEMDAVKHVDDVYAEHGKKNPDDWITYDVWIEPTLRDPLDAFGRAVRNYQFRVELRWTCVRDRWDAAMSTRLLSGGQFPAPGVAEKRQFDHECLHGVYDLMREIRETREVFQRELDVFVNKAITPPGMWQLIFGGEPVAPPPGPPRRAIVEDRELEEVLLTPKPVPAVDAAAENEALLQELAAPIDPGQPR